MIRQLFSLLDAPTRRLNRRQLLRIVVAAAVEGLAYGLTLPVIAALVGGDLTAAGIGLLPLTAATALAMVTRERQLHGAAATALVTVNFLQRRIARHVSSLPTAWFNSAAAAALPQNLSWGAVNAGRGAPFLLISLIGGVVTPAVVFLVALVVDWRPALIMLLAAPVLFLVQCHSNATVDRVEERSHRAGAEATARIIEFADTQPTLRASGRVNQGWKLLESALDQQYAAGRTQVIREVLARVSFGVTVNLAVAATVATLVWALTGSLTSTALLLALLLLTVRFAEPIIALGDASRALRSGRVAVGKLCELLAEKPLPVPSEPPAESDQTFAASPGLSDATGSASAAKPPALLFKKVRYRSLEEFSLEVPSGTLVALVGPSGAGKSTVLSLAARFADPCAGQVLLDGVDLRQLTLDQLYQTVGVVLQDSVLLSGSIRDNLLAACDQTASGSPAESRLQQVCQLTGVDSIFERRGENTAVGEQGRELSGGERQRVALARTLLAASPVVLLDEVTSALDPVNEELIARSIRQLRQQRTVLMAAHRLPLAASADLIVVLDAGRIVEQGQHEALLRRQGLYSRLWEAQSRATGWHIKAEQEVS